MNSPTLEDLYYHIVSYGPEHFDMSIWENSKLPVGLPFSRLDLSACGTTACLAGHGAVLMSLAGIPMSYATFNPCLGEKGFWSVVAKHYGIDEGLFTISGWKEFSIGDRNMRDVYHEHVQKYGDIRPDGSVVYTMAQAIQAQYDTVVEWLEWELKDRAASTSTPD
jgi:hypothetical protein